MSYINDIGRNSAKIDAEMRNLASELIIHGKLILIQTRAKRLQTFIEPLVTLAKRGDLHSRRQAIAKLRKIVTKEYEKDGVIPTLFTTIAERYKDRNGGYTRLIKVDNRMGDNAPMVLITFV